MTREGSTAPPRVKIAIFGAGAIGCWVGGRLAAGGADVTLIGRPRVMAELANGLRVSDLDGRDDRVTVTLATEPAAAAAAAIVLVTVKSAATGEAGRALAGIGHAIVVSLQNGVRNADALRAVLPDRQVLAGMVPFNVVRRAAGAYQRTSGGTLMIEPGADALVAACRAAQLAIAVRDDMVAVQWSKLSMNLNNAINALSGRPLADQLSRRDYRRCLAAAQRELIELCALANQDLARIIAIPPRFLPRMLELPDAIFKRLAGRIVAIDPHARSSMWDDLEARRPTEIDYLQGEVVALAGRLGRPAPINTRLLELVRAAEAGGKRDWDGPALLGALYPR